MAESGPHGQRQNVVVVVSGRYGANRNNVMRRCFEIGHGVARNIFISVKAHLTRRSDIFFVISAVGSRTILHGAPALAELAVTIGALDPTD